MPKQLRGFWVCVYCEHVCDTFETAQSHETNCPYNKMVAAVEHIPTMEQPQHGDYTTATSSMRKEHTVQRYLPLMGSSEPSTMIESDTLVCRSMEFFENLLPSAGAAQGQVGLRCAFCAETPVSVHSYIFPSNTRSIGDSLRHNGMQHLATCSSFPEDYKRTIQDAMNMRNEGGEQDESTRRTLMGFCMTRCQQVGIVDRHPTGLAFSESSPAQPPVMQLSQQQQQQTPQGGGYPPQRPPSYADRPPYGQQSAYAMQQQPAPQQAPPYYGRQEVARREDDMLDPAPLQGSRDPPPPYSMPTYQVPPDFPFFLDQNRWLCKYCAHVPPPYRDPQYFWGNVAPPPDTFVDYHLSVCREFQKGLYEQQQRMQQYQRRTSMGWEPQPGMVPATPRMAGYPSAASPQQQSSYPNPSFVARPQGGMVQTPLQKQQPPMEMDTARAIDYLEANDLSKVDNDGNLVTDADKLVLEEDRLLLTEYFFYLMKQLRQVRFSEDDRRTRGGKREKIKVGYGGLQCVHCVDVPNTRKFFWSNVDRLANSFAEIPSHVLKCRRCPQPCKDALLLLKQRHAEQMSRLPRGSQKVFFRRMWRRLHAQDPVDEDMPVPVFSPPMQQQYAIPSAAQRPSPIDTKLPAAPTSQQQLQQQDISPSGTASSEESIYFLRRPATEGAKALVSASIQPGPPSPSSRVLLAIPEDREWLSDTDCFIRRQLEVFCATENDVQVARSDRKYPVSEGQVGIRCIHCALSTSGGGAKGQAVSYPFSISGIYEAAREFQRLHLESCENLPLSAKAKLESLKGAASLSSVLRKYFVLAAKALGLQDTVNGIRAGADSVPIGSQAAFAFSDDPPPMTASKKRKAEEESDVAGSSMKRAAVERPPPPREEPPADTAVAKEEEEGQTAAQEETERKGPRAAV